MGIDTIKFSLVPSSIGVSINNTQIQSLSQLVSLEPSYREVFDMPQMKNYVLWAYTLNGPVVKEGLTEDQKMLEYRQIRDLTLYLLREYSGSGKTFYLGNWETDWGVLGIQGYDGDNPKHLRVGSAIEFFNIRQSAIDDAKAYATNLYRDVNVFHYIEVVMVKETKFGKQRCLNTVIPYIPMLDFVSWSAYTVQDDDIETIHELLTYIESFLPKSKSNMIQGKRVFIGEFGWKYLDGDAAALRLYKFTQSLSLWGCPFAFFWQMYTNEKNTQFCLIRPDGSETKKLDVLRSTWKQQTSGYDNIEITFDRDNQLEKEITLLDNATIDLNGFNQEVSSINNIGMHSRIMNSSTKESNLIISSISDITFGGFNNNTFNGVRNGGGDTYLTGNVTLLKKGVGNLILDSSNITRTGTTFIEEGSIVAKVDGSLGIGTVYISNGGCLNITCRGIPPIVIGNDASIVRILCSCEINNTIEIGKCKGQVSRGVIDVDNNSQVHINNVIHVNGVPLNGGHFGTGKNSLLILNGEITATVPVVWRRNNGIISGGGKYETFRICHGVIKLGGNDGIAREAVLEMGSHGDATFDLNGYNQVFSRVVIISTVNKCVITNTSTLCSSILIIGGTKTIIDPNTTITL